jgi:hypothetical protein
MLSLSLLMGEERAATVLRPALGILVTVNLIPLGMLVVDVRTALARAYRPRELTGLAAVCLIGGALLPLYLLVAGVAPRALLAAALCVALAGLGFASRSSDYLTRRRDASIRDCGVDHYRGRPPAGCPSFSAAVIPSSWIFPSGTNPCSSHCRAA